jgi:tetratricopeptide (TPR) repeat protein
MLRKGEHLTSGAVVEDCASKAGSVGELPIESETLLDVPVQARSLERLSLRERERFRRARRLLAEGGGVRALALGDLSVEGLGVYEALLAQGWSMRFTDPVEMVRLALAATEVAKGLDARGYGAKRLSDLKARAWGELGNAYRTADRLHEAQSAFGRAYALLKVGSGDPYLKARLFDLESSLFGAWREFPLAGHRLASLFRLYQGLGELRLAGRTMIVRALYVFYSGEAEEAVRLNEEGLGLIDRQRDPGLLMVALHNHLLFLVELRRFRLARRMLFENRQQLLYRDKINALKLRGVEGKISYGLGELLSAEITFRETKHGFVEAGLAFASAIASLDLAMALLSQGRVDEAEKEVIAAQEIFLAVEVYREFLGAMIYLEECFRRNEATTDLIENTIRYLWRREMQTPTRRPK